MDFFSPTVLGLWIIFIFFFQNCIFKTLQAEYVLLSPRCLPLISYKEPWATRWLPACPSSSPITEWPSEIWKRGALNRGLLTAMRCCFRSSLTRIWSMLVATSLSGWSKSSAYLCTRASGIPQRPCCEQEEKSLSKGCEDLFLSSRTANIR